ncbi:MAG: glycoside hydrolase family 127 protein [Bacteroidaceae bacterium]|nr:glycoside hydrolase family 127 protein [Bacteroidaceae bacterium]
MKRLALMLLCAVIVSSFKFQVSLSTASAQSLLYPKHFDLTEVTLLDGPMKTAMELNFKVLMQYDVDRLLTPFVRQSGLAATTDTRSPYYRWEQKHPSFPNWGSGNFNLDGHVGGHYLTALSLAYAACSEASMKEHLKEHMEYMVRVMKDCQSAYDDNTEGLYGFIGGQPINDSWKQMYQGSTEAIGKNWGWVPFYCQHKILAGVRDAYIYGGNADAREMFRKLADWSVNLIAKVSDTDLQGFLNCEHGGMNESLLDAYQLFGDEKYLKAAKRYTHQTMLNGMQTLNTTFLDNKHANTQVPKYIGMERIGELESSKFKVQSSQFITAAENFWTDVAKNRTVCIGGNSVAEHFLTVASSNRYIDHLDGPESCNTNNMLKLSEMMGDRTGDAKYVDFYEQAIWNHILSTQDPVTGGYVYFTTLRPQAYRIYSQVNQGMWCCVGTGMENHSKYGHFIYAHDGKETLYVNLFTPSRLLSDDFVVTQETQFPFESKTTLTIGKAGTYTVAVRHPAWVGSDYQVSVNGAAVNVAVTKGTASYVTVHRTWSEGDKIEVSLPMELRYEVCPNYTDYIAFKYGPILLAANVSSDGETLPNEYAGAGRMDHAPGSMASSKNLLSAPLLIGERADVLSRIQAQDLSKLTFTLDASREGVETYKWKTLTLQPFYQIHHARYSCYWYQQTAENFANSSMAQTEAANEALLARTLDFVAPGEQQSEAGHEYNFSSDSSKGSYNGENYRDARAGGHVQYTLFNPDGADDALSILCRFTTADHGRKATLWVDGVQIAKIEIPSSVKNSENGFYNIEYPIPASLVHDAGGQVKTQFTVRLAATEGTLNPGLYYLRLMRGYVENAHAYQFRAQDWTTGDPNRIAASNITYDTERNVIKAKSTGNNNIALMMKYQNLDYDIDKSQVFLVVRGTGLRTATGASYLWWLNGKNRASQVEPTTKKSIKVDGQSQTLIAWNMTKSGLYDNFTGDRPNVCMGQTIFGLTSSNTDGSCEIYDINFASSVEDYIIATHIAPICKAPAYDAAYTLQGLRVQRPDNRLYIQNGKKYIKNP